MKTIKIFAPATVANVSCGFDILGLCLETKGDEMRFTKTNSGKVVITKIEGADLSYNNKENIVGIVAEAMLEKTKPSIGVEIEVYKKIKPGSGIGSSAASAAGTAFGMNEILGKPFTKNELIEFAMLGEKFVGGAMVADNVAPAILGGITLVKSYTPFQVFNLPVPKELYVVLAHPQVEVKTSDSRRILKSKVSLNSAIQQSANLASLVHALHTEDYDLLGTSLEDVLVEPTRSILIPLFQETKNLSKNKKALGTGISGAGPSIFTLCKGKEVAQNMEKELQNLFQDNKIDCHVFVSKINESGIQIIKD